MSAPRGESIDPAWRVKGIGVTFLAREETSLLQRFRDGERMALDSVYRAYVHSVARAVAGAVRRYGHDGRYGAWREAATELPDLVQDVFERAFEPRTRRRFDGVREYGPYLRRIARNVVVDYLRRCRRQATWGAGLLIDEICADPAPQEQPVEQFADLLTMMRVSRFIARLPSDVRRVHQALYVDGLSQREAAAALGLGRQTVRTLQHRLREGLRTELAADRGAPRNHATSNIENIGVRPD